MERAPMVDARDELAIGLYEKALPGEWPWEERLKAAARTGYGFVEMSIDESEPRLARLDWSATERATLRQAVANAGLPILTLCLSGHRKFPLGSHSLAVRQRGLGMLCRAIDLAADIGARMVQIPGYDVFYEPSDKQTQDWFVQELRSGIRHASRVGVMIGLENMDTPFVDSVSKGLHLVQQIDSPWFQLYPDIGNLTASGHLPADELRLAAGHLVGVHVKDTRPNVWRGVPLGEGDVPLEETFHALGEIGFCGPITVEMWSQLDVSGDPLCAAVTARRLVGRLIDLVWAGETA
jgi:L-ribulose-5-phosphate 3-epimerase